MVIPSYILVNAKQDRYVLLQVFELSESIGTIVIANPQVFVDTCEWQNCVKGDEEEVRYYRKSSRHDGKEYTTKMYRTGKFCKMRDGSQVYEYSLCMANTVLPSEYYKVSTGKDTHKKYHFTMKDKTSISIPVHIFHMYVEAAIAKKEECPITMEAFTKENVASTPCGHLFEYSALKEVLLTSGSCPTCRSKATSEQIQVW